MTLLAIFVGLVFLHSLVSARLERTVVTAPIVFNSLLDNVRVSVTRSL